MNKRGVSFILILALATHVSTANLSAENAALPDPELLSVGALSVSNLYLGYLVLGTVADGFIRNNYEPKVTRDIAQETIFLNEKSLSSLQSLLNTSTIAREDQAIMYEIIQSYNLLINMAEALVSFANEENDGSAYHVFRTEAWDQISSLLGAR